jgi:Tol biopolymer transport system component
MTRRGRGPAGPSTQGSSCTWTRWTFSLTLVGLLVSGCTDTGSEADVDNPDAPSSQGAGLGDLVYAKAGGNFGDETIVTANADGSGERHLTKPGQYCCPRVSPDGTRILVMTNDQPGTPITGGTIKTDGSGFESLALTDPTLNLVPQAWSPDGARISFEGWDDTDATRTGVYTARASDGGDLLRLTTAPSADVHDIPSDYSPDGTHIVFYRTSSGADWDIGGSLWIVNTDGSDARPIDTGGVVPSWWARWSPDGSRIVFATARNASAGELWTVDGDGSNPRVMFHDAEGRWPITPAWSPGGDRIIFGLNPIADEFEHPPNVLYTIRADGSELTAVVMGEDFKRRIEWLRE